MPCTAFTPRPPHWQVDEKAEAPAGRGGAACAAIGSRRLLVYGGASREPTAWDDWWVLELSGPGAAWTKISPVVKLSQK